MNQSETAVTAIHAVNDNSIHQYPLYGSQPAAGFPAPGDDLVEASLNIHDLVVQNPTATFFVRVRGDSMEGIGIFSGDVLVVDRSKNPRSGDVVVAAVFGELVVKKVRQTRHALELVSEQAGYEPIILENSEDCFIWGVVVGSVRKF